MSFKQFDILNPLSHRTIDADSLDSVYEHCEVALRDLSDIGALVNNSLGLLADSGGIDSVDAGALLRLNGYLSEYIGLLQDFAFDLRDCEDNPGLLKRVCQKRIQDYQNLENSLLQGVVKR